MQSDGFNSTLSPVVYGDIVLNINTHYIMLDKMPLSFNYSLMSLYKLGLQWPASPFPEYPTEGLNMFKTMVSELVTVTHNQ